MTIPIADTLATVPPARTGRTVTEAQRAFFRAMPKVELHCHLLGAVRPQTFADLAAKHGAPMSGAEIEAFYRRGAKPVGVLHVLRALERHLLLEPDDFRRIAYEYLEDAAAESVRHAEFFWNPTATLRDTGLAYREVQAALVAGIAEAAADHGISGLLIPSIDREADPAAALEMVELMAAARHPLVPGIGIDYRETDRPPELFAEAYALARRQGLRLTAHAGEFGTPWRNVETVVDRLGVDRVDHGYSIVDNPELMRGYADRRMVFTVVPTNSYYLRTLAPERWAAEHPIRRMAAAGLAIHPNTDDPTLHRVSPAGAWELMYSHLGFGIPDLRGMMTAGIAGSWADAGQRSAWHAQWPALFDTLAAGLDWEPSTL
ncbi:adenosine deaminase [Nitrospirillum sp. BR 11164]|uniref:adenosine deaminase family protein n=1 Tax=Nitrospirillum sp. BR 11164 TaxID=3104324 RepID=UPI002AFFE1B3|nr:adenosine deaminase [Nitrospirillum sp. BR 11164]MEA1651109.1 adenosine deaminase [Nitrospirillum sp. BR 11164]